MRRTHSTRLALALCLAVATPAGAELYRYVDADGREHWTEDPAQVPESQRQSLPKRDDGGTLSGFEGSSPAAPAADVPRRTPGPGIAPPPTSERIAGMYQHEWQAESERLQQRIETAERNLEICEERDRQRRTVEGLTDLDACDWNRARIEDAEDELERFEDNAREQGVPPGWLR